MSATPSRRTPSMLRELAAKVCLPNGSRPGTMKITSSDIRLNTVAISPARLAFIQLSTRSRMACSSEDMGISRFSGVETCRDYVSERAGFRIAEIHDEVEDIRQGRRGGQCQRFFLNQPEFQRAHALLVNESGKIRFALP